MTIPRLFESSRGGSSNGNTSPDASNVAWHIIMTITNLRLRDSEALLLQNVAEHPRVALNQGWDTLFPASCAVVHRTTYVVGKGACFCTGHMLIILVQLEAIT